MKFKNIGLSNILFAIVFCFTFLLTNRIGAIIDYQLNADENVLYAILSGLGDIFSSFSPDYLGWQVVFKPIPILTSLVLMTGLIVLLIWGTQKRTNYREGEEHGSARYGDIEKEIKSLRDSNEDYNMLLSNNIGLSLDTSKTWLNDNVMVIGGSGSGKTRYYVKPNVLQMYGNYIITDPKGQLLPSVGNALVREGYDIKLLNLIDMDNSMCYNPLAYIYKPTDVLKFVNNLVESTTKQNSTNGGDDFFIKAEIAFLSALIFLLLAIGKPEEQNMNELMDLIDLAEASEEDENAVSILDLIFEELKEENRILKERGELDRNGYSFLAERQYSLYKKAAGKTAKSILISVGVRMAVFNIPQVARLLSCDELNLTTIGEPIIEKGRAKKTALFLIISDSDSTYTFLASILLQQLYDMLYMIADSKEDGRLPIHTKFMCDEFANVGKQRDFEIKIATMRSREISVDILLQNLAQLKDAYKDSWETIFGNCDTTIFLGGKEKSSTQYLSELIGNTTIDYLSISENKGGNNETYSVSNQLIQRPLISPDEMSRLPVDECLVHIRGYHVFKDKKYILTDHERAKYTTDAKEVHKRKENRFDSKNVVSEIERIKNIMKKENQIPDREGTLNLDVIEESVRVSVSEVDH